MEKNVIEKKIKSYICRIYNIGREILGINNNCLTNLWYYSFPRALAHTLTQTLALKQTPITNTPMESMLISITS